MWNDLLNRVKEGDIKALARAVSMVENEQGDYTMFLKSLPCSEKKIIGITGPPGAGKSTIVDCLINEFITLQKSRGSFVLIRHHTILQRCTSWRRDTHEYLV